MKDRRRFLKESSFVLGAVTAGTVAPLNADATDGSGSASQSARRSVIFGWEVSNINNNGANIYFEVAHGMLLQSMEIDVAFMINSAPSAPGIAEVLCTAGISRGAPPTFSSGPQVYPNFAGSRDFANVTVVNPNGLNVGFDGGLGQGGLYEVILKTWVPGDGTASATSRNVQLEPLVGLQAGDFLFFHMDHGGVQGDAEMQMALGYTLM